MKRTFETRKLYFGFPVFFLGYKDDVHGYNISTSSSVYSLGSFSDLASKAEVESSKIKILGLLTTPLAMDIRCF